MKYLSIILLAASAAPAFCQLRLDANNNAFLNYDGQPVGSGSFTLGGSATFVGMYVDNASETGSSFYGYSENGLIKSFSVHNNSTESWELFVLSGTQLVVSDTLTSIRNDFEVGAPGAARFQVNSQNGNVRAGGDTGSVFQIDSSTGLLLNSDTQINSFTDFTLRPNQAGFGGMYVDGFSNGAQDAKPFYGYAVEGLETAFHYYDSEDGVWKLDIVNINNNIAETAISAASGRVEVPVTLEVGDGLLVNTSDQLNEFTDFTLQSKNTGFGGMYVNVDSDENGRPFYGYGINGFEEAFHYYEAETGEWKLNVDGVDILNVGFNSVSISSGLKIGDSTSLSPGTIVFRNGQFFGQTSGGLVQLSGGSTARVAEAQKGSVDEGADFSETELLKKRVTDLENKLLILEQRLEQLDGAN